MVSICGLKAYPHFRQNLPIGLSRINKSNGCVFHNSRHYLKYSQLRFHQHDGTAPVLTPQEVTYLLRKNEFSKEFTAGSIKSYDCNQLASNDPIEDTRCEAVCKLTSGILVGVFDGHGGPQCARVISKRLLNYIAAALLPTSTLKEYLSNSTGPPLIECINEKDTLEEGLMKHHNNSFKKYLNKLTNVPKEEADVKSSLEQAFVDLDSDIAKEALESFQKGGEIELNSLSVALSGCVACVAHVAGPHLHVANAGDCTAVIGHCADDSNNWIAKKITKEHNSDNLEEVNRIYDEHPTQERKTVIRRDRLLGELAPLRSLGDYRYKWTADVLSRIAVPLYGPKAIPLHYHTPPYLTGRPDVFYHRLKPNDKFLIIASDGIWDMITPSQAVELVGEHMKGKVFFNPVKMPRKDITIGDLNEVLVHRKANLHSKPLDRNAATHLIRHAIGGTECGVELARLQHLLALPPDVSRMFRDDMTVTVLYFNTEHLRHTPIS